MNAAGELPLSALRLRRLRLGLSATLPQNVAIDIEPASGIANEATALVQAGCPVVAYNLPR